MRLSIIIPALDEEAHLGPTLERALAGQPHEVIVADGGSADRTAHLAVAHGARVVVARRGRGAQMNAGAAAALGDTLLFLHADTLLPAAYPQCVADVLGRPGVCAGAFPLRIDSPRRAFRLIERGVLWRSRIGQRPYGDQAVFMSVLTFRRAGGYRDLPAMEDYEFARRLRSLGRVGLAGAPVLTSPRRWLRGGIWRTTLLNQLCVAGFRLGVPAQRIAAWRGGPQRGATGNEPAELAGEARRN